MYRTYPIATLHNLSRNFDSLFNSFFAAEPHVEKCCGVTQAVMPAINVSEEKDHYGLEAIIPGVEPSEVNISVTGNTLTISNVKENANEEESKKVEETLKNGGSWYSYHFTRQVELPRDAETGKISAEYRHGVLRITVPKAEEEKPKTIEVKVH